MASVVDVVEFLKQFDKEDSENEYKDKSKYSGGEEELWCRGNRGCYYDLNVSSDEDSEKVLSLLDPIEEDEENEELSIIRKRPLLSEFTNGEDEVPIKRFLQSKSCVELRRLLKDLGKKVELIDRLAQAGFTDSAYSKPTCTK